MSEHQWTILIIGAATIVAFCAGRIAERVAAAREKRAEYEARKQQAIATVRILSLRPQQDDIPPAA